MVVLLFLSSCSSKETNAKKTWCECMEIAVSNPDLDDAPSGCEWLDEISDEEGEKIVSIADLGEFENYPFQAVFKHFFRINGYVEMPDGFEPEIVRISTKRKGRSYTTRDQEWGQ